MEDNIADQMSFLGIEVVCLCIGIRGGDGYGSMCAECFVLGVSMNVNQFCH